MYKCRIAAAFFALLALAALVPGTGAQVGGGVVPGETVTFVGPDPVELDYVDVVEYFYLWEATAAGETIATGTDKDFSFVVPDPGTDMMEIEISLLVTDGFGCIGETIDTITVYPAPPCGIVGPASVCEDSPVQVFTFADDPTGLVLTWTLETSAAEESAGTGEEVKIDWTGKPFGDSKLILEVSKTWEDGAVTTSTCEMTVKYVVSPVATIKRA